MLPRPSVDRIIRDVEVRVSRAAEDLAGRGLRMPPELREMVRQWLTEAYQVGVEAQREAVFRHLGLSKEGKAILDAPAAQQATSR